MAETLNLSRLDGYTTGGTIHIIANNQIGFTDRAAARPTARSTPATWRAASRFRSSTSTPTIRRRASKPPASPRPIASTFQRDFLIDLVGYRRYGHNEGDEPSVHAAADVREDRPHPTVREHLGRSLSRARRGHRPSSRRGDGAAAHASVLRGGADVAQAGEGLRRADAARPPPPGTAPHGQDGRAGRPPARAERRPADACPDGFNVTSQARSRAASAAAGDAAIASTNGRSTGRRPRSWPSPRSSTTASPIRLTGEDVERGTFSHRHAVFHDCEHRQAVTCPLQALPQAKAAFEIHNSPLTETRRHRLRVRLQRPGAGTPGDLGSAVRRLHQRRAGDDRRVRRCRRARSGGRRRRWCCCCRTATKAQGPDHSSARPERFLQLAADINMRVANCTTAAQYFHLLRRQALLLVRRIRCRSSC